MFAEKPTQLDLFKKDLRAVTAAEMPAKASQLVSQAKPEGRELAAQTVVLAASALRPVALVAVVGAIAREHPEVAAAAAAKAAALRPKESAMFARAAAGAAPGRVVKIVHAVCKAAPSEHIAVLSAVVQAVPNADREQLWTAVITAVPSLKGTSAPSSLASASFGALPPPSVGPPFTPVPGTPTDIDRSNTSEHPGGPRGGYAGP